MEYRISDRLRHIWDSITNHPTPIIQTKWGPVTEVARRQAALNMREDPKLMERVLAIIVREMDGDLDRAVGEMKRRYPEAFEGH